MSVNSLQSHAMPSFNAINLLVQFKSTGGHRRFKNTSNKHFFLFTTAVLINGHFYSFSGENPSAQREQFTCCSQTAAPLFQRTSKHQLASIYLPWTPFYKLHPSFYPPSSFSTPNTITTLKPEATDQRTTKKAL